MTVVFVGRLGLAQPRVPHPMELGETQVAQVEVLFAEKSTLIVSWVEDSSTHSTDRTGKMVGRRIGHGTTMGKNLSVGRNDAGMRLRQRQGLDFPLHGRAKAGARSRAAFS